MNKREGLSVEGAIQLAQLINQFAHLKEVEDWSRQGGRGDIAKSLEAEGRELYNEILKLDPNFGNKLVNLINQQFTEEADELNRRQHSKAA